MGFAYKKNTLRQKRLALQQLVLSNAFRFSLCVLVLGMGILYIVQLNTVSTKGFVIADLERNIHKLEKEQEDLSVKISTYRSMQSIEERLSNMQFTSVDSPIYIEVNDGAVVRR